mmetsp:Transcript_78091/g.252780  ORF Transcript_78091/g.252780 Transcript_78091/m.252780 type:complete len:238 (-) Transcript_78091:596-1309(-)
MALELLRAVMATSAAAPASSPKRPSTAPRMFPCSSCRPRCSSWREVSAASICCRSRPSSHCFSRTPRNTRTSSSFMCSSVAASGSLPLGSWPAPSCPAAGVLAHALRACAWSASTSLIMLWRTFTSSRSSAALFSRSLVLRFSSSIVARAAWSSGSSRMYEDTLKVVMPALTSAARSRNGPARARSASSSSPSLPSSASSSFWSLCVRRPFLSTSRWSSLSLSLLCVRASCSSSSRS